MSSAKGCSVLHCLASLRNPALAIGLFVLCSWTFAQDAAGAAAGIPDTGQAKAGFEEIYAAVERENKDLEERIAVLEKSNRELEKSANQLRQAVQVANTAGRRLSFSLARRVSRNVSRHVAGIAGTSIPYIGAGVSVAMTALDVKDGCESLKELNEMNRAMTLEQEDESHVCATQVPTEEQVIAQVINNWRTAYANAAAWANQYETRLPPAPPNVSYARVGELWTAVFGSTPKTVLQPLPMLPILPTLPTLPAVPTIKRAWE